MYLPLNVELASKLGVSAAISAQCLYDLIDGIYPVEIAEVGGKQWVRMGHRQLSCMLPILTPHMTKSALRRLVLAKILYASSRLNESPFDHTNWYAFTEYGQDLMVACGE